MQTVKAIDFRALMNGHQTAEIMNLFGGAIVRKLTVEGENVQIEANLQTVTVPLDTKITYEAWDFDRGSLLFDCSEVLGPAKICTEADLIRYPGSQVMSIMPGDH